MDYKNSRKSDKQTITDIKKSINLEFKMKMILNRLMDTKNQLSTPKLVGLDVLQVKIVS